MKIQVTDYGDSSVGIFDAKLEIDCPFDKGTVDEEDLEAFREGVRKLYNEFSFSQSVEVLYDFELLAERERRAKQ